MVVVINTLTVFKMHVFIAVIISMIGYVQLQEQYGRELCIVVTNLSRMCSEYCNTQTCPDLPIRAAVRMSMAYPGTFYTVLMSNEWVPTAVDHTDEWSKKVVPQF